MKTSRYDTKLAEAVSVATRAADEYGLPQTVFRTADTCGWANTNPLASALTKAELSVSILPSNYFK